MGTLSNNTAKKRSKIFSTIESRKIINKKNKLKFRYGITLEHYNKMLKKQNNACAICKRLRCKSGLSLAVDHCHKTKTVRGLLCISCNRALGLLYDNVNHMKNMIKYIKRSKSE